MGAMTTEGISILINESEGGCHDNRRYSNVGIQETPTLENKREEEQ